MRIVVVQLNSRDDLDENLAHAAAIIRQAYCDAPFDLAVLPEYTHLHGASSSQIAQVVEDVPYGKVSRFFRDLATEMSVAIHCGTINEPAPERKMYNASVVFDPNGTVLANYRKMHLIEATLPSGRRILETKRFAPGTDLSVFDFRGVRFGCATCYDFRFPELFRCLRRAGAEVILYVAALSWEHGVAHQEVLLRARAIETQCYLVAAAQCGYYDAGKKSSYGNSMIIDPWGRVEARLGDDPGYIAVTIRPELLKDVRDRMPLLSAADKTGLDKTVDLIGTRLRLRNVGVPTLV